MSRPSLDQRVPCARCPWRKDADPSYWHPGEFLRMTRNIRDGGVMLCHKSPGASEDIREEERSPLSGTLPRPALCAGYVVVDRYQNLGLRIFAMGSGTDPTTVCSDGGVDLHGSWDEVLLRLVQR